MVETKDIAGISTIGILLIASILGFMPEDDVTHFCADNNMTMACDRLSSTSMTCYPDANTTKGSKRCTSLWQFIDRSDLIFAEETIKVELRAGGFLECEVIDSVIKQNCYFNGKEALRSEFD